ncbi:hypothetical protein DM01DRAFT_326052 [Hesseltinella vesiculosa]|uniref:CBS domain-containing protein n=1 Tax=Hesseltinella vesiculosa TaxID=101127 RepID=A0A1X2GE87_9FUNG|nr:hypothetical protein DM01DRAFT_326052 [Hesseltinella vesiculosa]
MIVSVFTQYRILIFIAINASCLNDTYLSISRIIRKQRVYRVIVVAKHSKLLGIVSLPNVMGDLIGL